jgi:hypothetical protein
MENVEILGKENIGRNFIPREYLPAGKDEYHLRNQQSKGPTEGWRRLSPEEIERLLKNGNSSDNWENILVAGEFNPDLIKNSEFFGLVRIGSLRNIVLKHQDTAIPAGITNSRIISCDIGDDTAVHNVRYLAHNIIGNRCILSSIDEMLTTEHARFGNGILKDGEQEDSRIWIKVINEPGGRKLMPFDGMIPADAYLWAKYRDDGALQKKLSEFTDNRFDPRRGFYGTVGDQCVIKNSRILKDIKTGYCCTINGANEIKNVTINSSAGEPTAIGEGTGLSDGIVGLGCRVHSGARAARFILGDHSTLKYGALLIDSFLGENSTLSSCEVRNSLIFAAHEQHHRNSFLIATVVMGQSNVAAGAVIGSNHNSRSNDGEIQAGRGFWPGLCVSLKHSCRFASFVLVSKADYPAELDISIPFSLVNNNSSKNQLEVMPGYWWLHNMYALVRNSWKFANRDKRKNKTQNIEFDPLAPDTIEEIFRARRLLEIWTGRASLRKKGKKKEEELARIGRELLAKNKKGARSLEVLAERMERSERRVVIINVVEGYEAYGDMLHHYAVKNCCEYLQQNPHDDFDSLCKKMNGKREREWTNMGGQLVPAAEADRLRADIGSGALASWEKIHERYNRLWEAYPRAKQRHAFAVLCNLLGTPGRPTKKQWLSALDKAVDIQEYTGDRVYRSRKKDNDNPFRQATFRNPAEMKATVGTAEDDSIVRQVQNEIELFKKTVEEIRKRG